MLMLCLGQDKGKICIVEKFVVILQANQKIMAKIGIYGGSFNPVHFGHIGLVKWVLEHSDLDEIWMLVSPKSPHKADRPRLTEHRTQTAALTDRFNLDTNYAERLEAAKKAIQEAGLQRVVVSDFETKLPLPSYTANTLRELKKQYPEHEFSLIIGEDNWDVFDKWREWEYILQNYRVFVYPRRTQNTDRGNAAQSRKNVVFLDGAPYFDISSTQIRKKMQKDLHN